jgi:hypothetical protein
LSVIQTIISEAGSEFKKKIGMSFRPIFSNKKVQIHKKFINKAFEKLN